MSLIHLSFLFLVSFLISFSHSSSYPCFSFFSYLIPCFFPSLFPLFTPCFLLPQFLPSFCFIHLLPYLYLNFNFSVLHSPPFNYLLCSFLLLPFHLFFFHCSFHSFPQFSCCFCFLSFHILLSFTSIQQWVIKNSCFFYSIPQFIDIKGGEKMR